MVLTSFSKYFNFLRQKQQKQPVYRNTIRYFFLPTSLASFETSKKSANLFLLLCSLKVCLVLKTQYSLKYKFDNLKKTLSRFQSIIKQYILHYNPLYNLIITHYKRSFFFNLFHVLNQVFLSWRLTHTLFGSINIMRL